MADGKLIFDTGIDDSGFKRDAGKLKGTAGGIGAQVQGIIGGMLDFGAIKQAATFMLDFGKAAVSAASDLKEVQNVVDTTFGENASSVNSWAEGAREQFGLTELQAKRYASTMGAMFKSMGLASDETLDMSLSLAGLAADMSSFYNLDFDTAFDKIRSGIAGETEPLKQLGINMSVANLEAFALSQGITKSYQSMTQAQQAMLRYNYLMQATTDVQGDFAKTSDELANSVRLLETNWNELLVGVGEAIEPLVSGTVDVLNDVLEALTGGSQTAAQQIEALGDDFSRTTAEIETQAFVAKHLANQLVSMGDYASLSADGQREWKAIAEKLISIVPSLSSEIDIQTGSFRNGKEAIYEHIDAIEADAKAQAAYAARTAIMQKAVDANENYFAKIAEHEAAYAKFLAAQDALEKKEAEISDQFGMSGEALAEAWETWSDMLNSGQVSAEFMKNQLGFSPEQIKAAVDGWYAVRDAERAASSEAVKLGSERDDLKVQAEAATKTAKNETNVLNDYVSTLGAVNEATGGPGGTTENTNNLANAMDAMEDPAKKVAEALEQIEQYRLENLSGVRQELEGAFDLFDKPGRVKKGNIKSDTKNLEAQKEYWERYNKAVEELKKRDGGDEWVAELADGTEESLSKLEMLAYSDIGLYEDATRSRDEAAAAMEATAESVSASKLKVDETYNELIASTENAVNSMNMGTQAYAAGEATMNGLISGISSKIPGLSGVIAIVSGLLGTIGGLLGLGTSGGGDGGEGGGDGGSVGPKSVRMLPAFADAGGYSTGLSYVPYNDFPAFLHEGEAVLTKAQASLWRAGWTGAWTGAGSAAAAGGTAGGGSFQQVNNFNVPVQTPDEFAKTMRLYATYGLEGVI